jgi:hypothetical protein
MTAACCPNETGIGVTYRFTGPSIVFFDEELNTARAKSDPVEMLQLRKANSQVHGGLPELWS